MDNETLATEMLREIKLSARRWFIIALVEFIALVTIVVIYLVVPEEELDTSVTSDNGGNANYIGHDLDGGIYNGISKSELQEESTP